MKLPIHIKIFIAVVMFLIVYSAAKLAFSTGVDIFNKTTEYRFDYDRLVEYQVTTFDNNYLIFKDKSNITNLNKETFIKVTEIIFSARTDGEKVAWKWVHENQQVDYNEFSKFYSDLSQFTKERFTENNAIEAQKQKIVQSHNLLITTFPGNVYNHYLKIKPLTYSRGFITAETKVLFNK